MLLSLIDLHGQSSRHLLPGKIPAAMGKHQNGIPFFSFSFPPLPALSRATMVVLF